MRLMDRIRIQLLRRRFVDKDYYYRTYPDVAKIGVPSSTHYNKHGWREGRNPSASFNTLFYAIHHLPNRKLTENPLDHFISRGGAKTRFATKGNTAEEWTAEQQQAVSTHFDEAYYQKHYKKILGNLSPIDHYFAVGWRTGCNPSENFDTKAHVEANPHVVGSDLNPLFHYVMTSEENSSEQRTGRTSTSSASARVKTDSRPKKALWVGRPGRREIIRAIGKHFDADFYKALNGDVAESGVNPLLHFVDHGWREGRNPSALFDTRYYQTRYGSEIDPDVNPLLHYIFYGREKGYRPNPIGSELWPRPEAPADDQWSRVFSAADPKADVSIIIPVYRGYEDTLATIFSVLTNPQRARFRLLVINDRSPDAELSGKLRELGGRGLFTYVENKRNLGFIGSINAALEIVGDRDVVLLNADTLVFGDWLDRMLAHARADTTIATITPYSNNAEICSYPDINHNNVIALEISPARIDEYASLCNRGRSTVVPTGVGFCFYIRNEVIKRIGKLDPAFGRGYGEENDFCMRAMKAGHKNVLAEDVFVFHSGKVSLAEFYDEEFQPGQTLLLGLHPDYKRRVTAFVRSDPGLKSRARLDLFRLARRFGEKTALFISMDGEGGVRTHIELIAKRFEAVGVKMLLAMVGGDKLTIRPFEPSLAIYTPSLKPIDMGFEGELFAEFIDWLKPEFIHLHSVALASWATTQSLMSILGRFDDRLYVTMHDYDPMCFRHNMVDPEGRFCARREAAVCSACVVANPAPNRCHPERRAEDWRAFLRKARRVFVPSEDTSRRFSELYPEIEFTVRAHEERLESLTPIDRPPHASPLRLVAIGAIGAHKGGDVLYAMAQDARTRNLPIEFHVVGYTAIPSEMKSVGVSVSGRYDSVEECVERLADLTPSFALILSIWPETYCYTLSLALALGLPPIVFDLGAQAERVRAAGFGVTLAPDMAFDPSGLNDAILKLSVADEWAKVKPVRFRSYDEFPVDYYDLGAEAAVSSTNDISFATRQEVVAQ